MSAASDVPRVRFVTAVPNALSAARLILAAAFPLFPLAWRLPAVFVAAFTDWLDGWVARRWQAGSAAGQLLDAVADKGFALSVLITLTVGGQLAWWQALLVLARDLSVGFVALYVTARRAWGSFHDLVPRLPGKLTTTLQFMLFGALLLWPDGPAPRLTFWLTAVCSIVAAADYLGQFLTAPADATRR
jgi:CDP-diacylglycerol--glycerol-3-phosphate 3-phosphatidyltransferase/cardiolipin synthase